MTEAFDLAERGRGSTHPNPLVGAVLVRDGAVVGRGWHRAPGEPHAEAGALAEAGEAARGATLYCTLEPCSHQGKTPPCADALVAAGVSRAVVALRDPNPQVDGRGLQKLRDGGVTVELAEERFGARAREQNAPFLKFHRDGLPLVTYKAAISAGRQGRRGGRRRALDQLPGQPPRRARDPRPRRRRDGRRRHGAQGRPRADRAAGGRPRPGTRGRHAQRRAAGGREAARDRPPDAHHRGRGGGEPVPRAGCSRPAARSSSR